MNTEERIMKAFKEMARQQGFYAVRMEDLAANAGISKATIYSYFSSKEDLVNRVVDAFLFNFRSLKDLQIYYLNAWKQVEEFSESMVTSNVEVIMKRTNKKWVLEMNPLFLKESFIALNNHFTMPESAAKVGMSLEDLSVQLAKLFIYPYLDQ